MLGSVLNLKQFIINKLITLLIIHKPVANRNASHQLRLLKFNDCNNLMTFSLTAVHSHHMKLMNQLWSWADVLWRHPIQPNSRNSISQLIETMVWIDTLGGRQSRHLPATFETTPNLFKSETGRFTRNSGRLLAAQQLDNCINFVQEWGHKTLDSFPKLKQAFVTHFAWHYIEFSNNSTLMKHWNNFPGKMHLINTRMASCWR